MTTTTRPARSAALTAAATVLLLGSALLASGAASALPTSTDDPDLDQTLGDLEVTHGTRVLSSGHVDVGPSYDGDAWRLLVHDDLARTDAAAASVWCYPAETVLQVVDAAMVTVPDDPAYAFVGADPGESVWVIPQTQNADVVWLGWNTQDPQVMSQIDRGVTLTLTRVQGPGIVTVYLHSGTFDEPQVLWDSRVTEPQPLWVDVNTHTHASWVFTEPGSYLMEVTASADLVDGTAAGDTQTLRFAVGSATATDETLAVDWAASPDDTASTSPGSPAPDASADAQAASVADDGGSTAALVAAAVGGVAVGLLVWFAVAMVRSSRARRAALAVGTSGEREGAA